MRVRMFLIVLLTFSLILLASAPIHAQELPEEGKNYIWVDLGEENEGYLLTQEEQADGISEVDEQGGVECRKQPFPYGGPGNNHMYFRIDDTFMFGGGDNEVWIVMEYFDLAQQIDCQYDSTGVGPVDGSFRGSGDGAFDMLIPEGTETWKYHVWHIEDGLFQNRANGSDFRLSTHGSTDMWINRVWITLFEPEDPFNPDDLSQPGVVHPGDKLGTTWAKLKMIGMP